MRRRDRRRRRRCWSSTETPSQVMMRNKDGDHVDDDVVDVDDDVVDVDDVVVGVQQRRGCK